MCAKSKKSLPTTRPVPRSQNSRLTKIKSTTKSGVNARPFAPSVWQAALQVVAQYQIIVSQEDGHWYGRGLELPSVFGDGTTAKSAVEMTREALAVAVAFLLEQGKNPPAAAGTGLRTQQVNIRLTSEEKALLESVARNKGFSGLSDFIRAAAIEAVR